MIENWAVHQNFTNEFFFLKVHIQCMYQSVQAVSPFHSNVRQQKKQATNCFGRVKKSQTPYAIVGAINTRIYM